MILAELQEKRNKLATQIREKAKAFEEAGKKWKDDGERQNWEKLNADYNAVMSEMEEVRKADEVAKRLNELDADDKRSTSNRDVGRDDAGDPPSQRSKKGGDGAQAIPEEVRLLAFQGWMRMQSGIGLKRQHREALRTVRAQPHMKQLRGRLLPTLSFRSLQNCFRHHHPTMAVAKADEQFRSMSSQLIGSGGALLMPETLIRTLEVNMLAFGGMLQVAEVIRTATGERMSWPTVDDTSNEGEQIGESSDVSNSGAGGPKPTTSRIYWDAYKLSSKMIKVPYELLEDSAFALAQVLGEMLGERLGRVTNRKATLGSGANTFRGIVTAATVGVTAASATAIVSDEIIRLIHSLDPAYRAGASFMCHDSVLLAIRLLKDGNGAYIWQSGLSQGLPDKIAGYNYTPNQHMADELSASADVMLFGRLSNYKIREVGGVRMYRLTERYRDTDEDGFIAMKRADGNLLTAGTPPVVKLRMHS